VNAGVECPCGSGTDYVECCEPIHLRGAGPGRSAEALMRARYSAYVLANTDFLLTSWHPDTRPADVAPDPGTEWLGLTVMATERGSGLDATGTVTFTARFRRGDEHLELQECSTFVRLDGKWVYVDGAAPDD